MARSFEIKMWSFLLHMRCSRALDRELAAASSETLSAIYTGMRELHVSASQLLEDEWTGGRKRGGRVPALRRGMEKKWDTFFEKRGGKDRRREDELESGSKSDRLFDGGASSRGASRRKPDSWKSFYEEGAEIRSVAKDRGYAPSSDGDSFDRPQRPLSRGRERPEDYTPRSERPPSSSSFLPYHEKWQSRDFVLRNRIYDDNKMMAKGLAEAKRSQLDDYTENDSRGHKAKPQHSSGQQSQHHQPRVQDNDWSRHKKMMLDKLQNCSSTSDLRSFIKEISLLPPERSNLVLMFAVKRLYELRASADDQMKVLDLLMPGILASIESRSKLRQALDLPSARNDGRQKEPVTSDWTIAYVLFHLVKMGLYDSRHTRELINLITNDDFRLMKDLTSRSLPQVMWSFAKIKLHGPLPDFKGGFDGLTRTMMNECIKLMEAGQSHPLFISNAAWSLGSLGITSKGGPLSGRVALLLATAARTEMGSLLSSFLPGKPPDGSGLKFDEVSLATFCHGLSQMHHYDPATMQMAGSLICDMYEKKTARDLRPLASYMFACATVIHYDSTLMHRISSIVVAALGNKEASYAPISINHIIWAFSVLKYFDADLVASVTEWTTSNADKFSIRRDQNLSLICWSLMSMGHEDEGSRRLIDVTSKRVLEEIAATQGLNETPADRSRLLHHVANFGQSTLILAPDRTDLMSDLIRIASSLLEGLKDQGVIDELLVAVRKETEEKGGLGEVTTEVKAMDRLRHEDHEVMSVDTHHGTFIACRSLWSIHMELVDRGLGDLGLKSWQLDACKEMWVSSQKLSLNVSSFQKEVFSVIKSNAVLGDKARSEVPTDDGLFSLDILIDHPQWGKVAVEVDGPFHFFSNLPGTFHGKAKTRNKFLARRVDKLISLNLDTTWKVIDGTINKKKYVSQLLGVDAESLD